MTQHSADNSTAEDDPRTLERQEGLLRRYATWLALGFVIVSSLGLLYWAAHTGDETLQTVLTSVATSMLAAAVFASVYTGIVERHQINVVSDQLRSAVSAAIVRIQVAHEQAVRDVLSEAEQRIDALQESHYRQIAAQFPNLLPRDYFPPTQNPDERFNAVVQAELDSSARYLFKGVTGRYIPARLEASTPRARLVEVLLTDPRRTDLLRQYVRDRFGGQGADLETFVANTQREIYTTIVDLFDMRTTVATELRLHTGPVFYRTELFDHAAIVSYFVAQTPTAYPVTYLYGSESFFYGSFMTDFVHERELAKCGISLAPGLVEDDLVAFLEKLRCSGGALSELRAEAKAFRAEARIARERVSSAARELERTRLPLRSGLP